MKRHVIIFLVVLTVLNCGLALPVCAESAKSSALEAEAAQAESAEMEKQSPEGSGNPASRGAESKGHVAKGAEYRLYAAVCVLSVVCMAYLLRVLNKERKGQ